jgi:uncharacterized protein (TIGR03118 family)
MRGARSARIGLAAALVVTAMAVATPAGAQGDRQPGFTVHNLVSDQQGVADIVDPSLVNAWGMSQSPTSPVWVSNNGTNTATLYSGDGVVGPVTKVPLTVAVPGDGVTGQVFNPTNDFVVSDGAGHSGPAFFIFDGESGDITGWNPNVPPPPPSTTAQPATQVPGAIYKGLAIASVFGHSRLYAANFHAGTIDVFDANFHQIPLPRFLFHDFALPAGYAPFNVAAFGDRIYVAYAKQDADAEDEVAGPGFGFVDVYTTTGFFLRRLVSRGQLNAPWGMAIAPAGFGPLGGDLLVGNFGNGRIHAYDPRTGRFEGTLRDEQHHPVEIDGLWALMFGNGTTAATDTLLFTAGPDDEAHGLYGTIRAAS